MGLKKYICLEGGGFVNKGAEAMVLTMRSALKTHFPKIGISVRVEEFEVQDAVENHLKPYVQTKTSGIIAGLQSKLSKLCFHFTHLAIIDVGGYHFGDPWGESRAEKRRRHLKYCKWFNIDIFFMPQAWGPFTSLPLARVTTKVIRLAKRIYARDKTSLDAVQSLVGKHCTNIRISHDIAWNFQGHDLAVGRSIIDASGLHRDQSLLLCTTPNMRVYERYRGKGAGNTYLRLLKVTLEYMCKKYNARVILMGHELRRENKEEPDDRVLCDYLLTLIDLPGQIVHLDKIFSAAELKSVIGNCDLLISSRYHALIAALSQEIPAITFGWSHKYDEIMSDVGLKDNIITDMDASAICERIDMLMARFAEMKQILKSTVPKMKDSGQNAVDDVIALLKAKMEN